MANVKLTALTAITGADTAATDIFVLDDVSVPETKKITRSELTVAIADANDYLTHTRVTANLDSFASHANTNAASLAAGIAGLSIDLSVGADSGDDDTVTVGTDTLRLVGGTGLESTVSDNQVQFDISDTAVTAGLYGGVVGTETQVPVLTIDAQGRITSASNAAVSVDLATLEGNVNTVSDNVELVRGNLDSFASDANTNAAALAAGISNSGTDFNPQINTVQDNVVAAEANVVLNTSNLDSFASTSNSNATALAAGIVTAAKTLFIADSGGQFDVNRTNNEKLDLEGFGGIETTAVPGAKKIQFSLTTVGNSGRYGGVDGTTLQIPQLVFDNYGRQLSASNVSYPADFASVDANVDSVQDNVTALTANVDIVQDNVAQNTANIDVVQDNVTANFNQLDANINVVQDNVTANFNQLDANISVVQDNVAGILDGTTFTGEVTMSDDLIVSGNLIVNGAQVDLGVSTATISNNLIELSAELGASDTPTTDSGLLINRGNEGNVFIGKSIAEDGVIFAHTLSPDTNVTIAIDEFMDAHANAFHAAADPSLSRVHFGLRNAEDTGIIVDDSGANINFVADGAYVANVHYDGTFNSQNAVLAPAIFSGEVELQANDSATLFSARANDYATYTLINANVDVVQDNVTANFNQLDANINVVQDNVAANFNQLDANINVVQDNVTANFNQLDANIDVVSSNVAAVESRRTANIAGAISTVLTSDLTASRALESDSSGKISASAVTTTELGYVNVAELGLVEASKALTANTDGEVTFPDDKKLYFGNDQDYSLDFDTTNTGLFLRGPATGEVRVNTNQFQVYNAAETQVMFRADAGSITNLYYNGTLVFQVGESNILVQGETDFAVQDNVQFGTNTSNTVEVTGEITTNSIDTTTLKLGGTTVTSTAAELNYNDGVTLGTSQASKVVTADSDGDVTLAADVTINGNVTIGTNDSNTVSITGTLDLGVLT